MSNIEAIYIHALSLHLSQLKHLQSGPCHNMIKRLKTLKFTASFVDFDTELATPAYNSFNAIAAHFIYYNTIKRKVIHNNKLNYLYLYIK